MKPALEVGARAIYDFRSHPRKARWEDAAAETRSAYRARMQELVNELSAKGFVIKRDKNHALNAELTPAEARLLKAARADSH